MASESTEPGTTQHVSVGKTVAMLLGLGLVMIPLAGYTWDVLSDLITGHLTSRKALIGLPVLIALAVVVRFAAGAVSRLDASTLTSDEKP